MEVIRNKVAHNRIPSDSDEEIAATCTRQLRTILGDARFEFFSTCKSVQPEIRETLRKAHKQFSEALHHIQTFKPLPDTYAPNDLLDQWWFDDAYLDTRLEPILNVVDLIDQYGILPRGRGKGHLSEEWVRDSGIIDLGADALLTLKSIINMEAAE